MLNEKLVICALLDCGTADVDMLLDSNIDVQKAKESLEERNFPLNFNNLYNEAFLIELYEVFDESKHPDIDLYRDFGIYTNCLDTHIGIGNNKYEYYKKKYSTELNAIEEYMGLEFEDWGETPL